ncbi:MinD/ParA family ATP-binding protein [Cryptosporangium minutisporangium]|uniref:MinD-like ATPase involved in chromosome partitioning or flagellar assembly n=1 Tax=Cryptosporangium minutisporangium TaxID=113569 RepID=A0ABP6T4Z0_9ACTN
MPLILWTSATGAPGITTTAWAVASAWPGLDHAQPEGAIPQNPAALVVEADPFGGDLAAWFRVSEEPGLAGLAAAARSPRGPDEMATMTHSYSRVLGGAQVVTAPVGSGQTQAALSILAAAGGPLAVTGLSPVPVLVDAGRWSPASPIMPLLQFADLIVLVTRASLADLAHTGELAARLAGLNPRRQALLRGPNPYGPLEVADQLGIPLLGTVPDDRRAATAPLRTGRSPRRGKWTRAITAIAAQLASEIGTGSARSPVPVGQPGRRLTAAPPRTPVTGGSPAGARPSVAGPPAGGAWPAPSPPRWPVPAQRRPGSGTQSDAPTAAGPGGAAPGVPGEPTAPDAPPGRPS